MGAICAIIYVLLIIVFIPFAFYKDIAAATSGGGNKDVAMTIDQIEFGRHMYYFPHNKVCSYSNALQAHLMQLLTYA